MCEHVPVISKSFNVRVQTQIQSEYTHASDDDQMKMIQKNDDDTHDNMMMFRCWIIMFSR